jgi:hypothetical protein
LLEQASAHGHLLGLHFSKKSLGQPTDFGKKSAILQKRKKIRGRDKFSLAARASERLHRFE